MKEIDEKTFERLRELHRRVKGLSVPTYYEEDGFFCSCSYCHGNMYKNEHADYCPYKGLQDTASLLDDVFK